MLSFYLPICLGMVSTADSMKPKGMPEFNPEPCSKTWVLVMDHIVRQAKLSNNTLQNICATYLLLNSPAPKVHAVKTMYLVKQSIQLKIALQPFAHKGSPVIKSIDHDPNLLSAMDKGSSKPGGAFVLSLAC